MKQHIYLIIFLHVAMFGCQKKKTIDKIKIQLKYRIIPEDIERNLYYVAWADTLGLSDGYLPDKILKRPKEIWCFVTNNQHDTLGFYHGSSMPQSFCYFKTTDLIVTLNFMIGLNILPEKFDKDSISAKAYWEANKTPIEFEPITVSVNTELRKEIEVELNEK